MVVLCACPATIESHMAARITATPSRDAMTAPVRSYVVEESKFRDGSSIRAPSWSWRFLEGLGSCE
jgi:hypothetical protein